MRVIEIDEASLEDSSGIQDDVQGCLTELKDCEIEELWIVVPSRTAQPLFPEWRGNGSSIVDQR